MSFELSTTARAVFERAGYTPIDPPILQPADIFLDLSGEEIRHRLFVTTDSDGLELALRPEFTIPVARAYLLDVGAGSQRNYCYSGPVFRVRRGEAHEFVQAGIESFGRHDCEAADAEILARAIEAIETCGVRAHEIRLGDTGLFSALLDTLGLAQVWQRRLKRAFAKGTLDSKALAAITETRSRPSEHAGLLHALEGQDPRAARIFVEDLMKIAGIAAIGGRSTAEIAERFLAQSSTITEIGLPDEARAILERYSAIEGEPDLASKAMRALSRDHGLKLDHALDSFDTRTGFMAARGINIQRLSFSARFGRNLDYYTGAVFEIRRKDLSESRPLVGGGRYDRLLQSLGSQIPVPAVGCAIFIDRLEGGKA